SVHPRTLTSLVLARLTSTPTLSPYTTLFRSERARPLVHPREPHGAEFDRDGPSPEFLEQRSNADLCFESTRWIWRRRHLDVHPDAERPLTRPTRALKRRLGMMRVLKDARRAEPALQGTGHPGRPK